ncbi:CTD nuclear envelope phosphatase 1 [Orchesella cincta]|uniref:CTD nuclear envelope phosphatase 1 homolog n=1 Tax=Orchesella cincta TaxID=48709 RepID=A0A1D2ME60_ORCCI|nr:CTD nuclear envelope phosphatase 1 [Orchesella cincta]
MVGLRSQLELHFVLAPVSPSAVKTVWTGVSTVLVALSNWFFGGGGAGGGGDLGGGPGSAHADTTTGRCSPCFSTSSARAAEGGLRRWRIVVTTIMWKVIQQGTKSLILFLSKIWNFILYFLRKNGRKVMQHQTIKYDNVPLSPLSKHRLSLVKRKVLVLDLDETLIHSHHDGVQRPTVKPGTPPDFILKVTIERHPVRFFVHKRPHVDYFLDVVSQWYDLVVFTASMEIYGAGVADKLDRNRKILQTRYYRQHCTLELGSYTKDLSNISHDLSSIFILDNSPGAYRSYPANAMPIKSWFSDPTDTALLNLLPVLDALRFTQDVRSVLSRNLHCHKPCYSF